MPVADHMQISYTKPGSISGSDDYWHILSVVPSMVTCYSHFFLQPPSKATLLSLFIVTFCCCFLLSRSEVAPGETSFAASVPGADNHNARFGLRLKI